MSGWTALAVAGGAAVGAPCRYLLDQVVQKRYGGDLPLGILLVNLSGSVVLGFLLGLPGLPVPVVAALGTGWCGAFTTYSTFGQQTLELARDGAPRTAAIYVLLSTAGGVLAATAGCVLAS